MIPFYAQYAKGYAGIDYHTNLKYGNYTDEQIRNVEWYDFLESLGSWESIEWFLDYVNSVDEKDAEIIDRNIGWTHVMHMGFKIRDKDDIYLFSMCYDADPELYYRINRRERINNNKKEEA